jgi:predicted chitinase
MLTGPSLKSAMSGDYPAPTDINYYKLVAEVNDALLKAGCTTNKRAAMFLAQIGAESGSLRWMEELADGSAYEWRSDLGNTHAGDGRRFKGRGPIQITGRHNYGQVSKWAHAKGYVKTSTWFVDHPTQLAWPKYRWLGAVWYWTVARDMNSYADRDDIYGATVAVNGGTNNLSGRTARWKHARKLGNSIVPTKPRSGVIGKITTPLHSVPKPTKPKPSPSPRKTTTYVVRSGDTMNSIAKRHGISLATLLRANPRAGHPAGNENNVFVGDKIRIP